MFTEVKYKCKACGWRWSKIFQSKKVLATRLVIVPADLTQCCGEAVPAAREASDAQRSTGGERQAGRTRSGPGGAPAHGATVAQPDEIHSQGEAQGSLGGLT